MPSGHGESPAGHVFAVSVFPGGASAWRLVAVCALAGGAVPEPAEAQADLAASPQDFRVAAARAIGGGQAHYGFADPAEGAAWAAGREEIEGHVLRRRAA